MSKYFFVLRAVLYVTSFLMFIAFRVWLATDYGSEAEAMIEVFLKPLVWIVGGVIVFTCLSDIGFHLYKVLKPRL